jgi:hypothetical protein
MGSTYNDWYSGGRWNITSASSNSSSTLYVDNAYYRKKYYGAPQDEPPGHFRDTRPEATIESPMDWLKRRVTEVTDEALRDVA